MDWIGKNGFGCFTDIDCPPEYLIKKAKSLSTPQVADIMGRHGAMDYRIKPLREGTKVVGPAIPVRLPPTDNLMAQQAIALAHPGDVLVVDTGGNVTNAPFGKLAYIPNNAINDNPADAFLFTNRNPAPFNRLKRAILYPAWLEKTLKEKL